jgi:hypothetical protein
VLNARLPFFFSEREDGCGACAKPRSQRLCTGSTPSSVARRSNKRRWTDQAQCRIESPEPFPVVFRIRAEHVIIGASARVCGRLLWRGLPTAAREPRNEVRDRDDLDAPEALEPEQVIISVTMVCEPAVTAHSSTRLSSGSVGTASMVTMRDDKVVKAFAFFDSVEFNELWTRVTPAIAKAERGGPKARLSLS